MDLETIVLLLAFFACATDGGKPDRARDLPDDTTTHDSGPGDTDTSGGGDTDTAGGGDTDTTPTGTDTTPTDTSTGCPDPPADLAEFTLAEGFGHPTAVLLASGQVGTIALAPADAAYASQQVAFGESAGGAYTPSPVTVEISLSHCKGVIDTDTTNYCNLRSQNGSYNSVTYFARAYETLDDYDAVNARGYCWLPESEGPAYVNMRWTYDACAYGAATCGFMVQLNPGPY